jgi:2-amino-4-hydroxy-6-hydroxymethyldihydropteridine diphosphokinase
VFAGCVQSSKYEISFELSFFVFSCSIFFDDRLDILKAHIAYISVGSNIGDKVQNCRNGIDRLSASANSKLINQSPFYRTSPVDYKDQDWFVNAVVQIATCLDPPALLNELQRIQKNAGRTSDPIRFGPRILDLDIIFFNHAVIKLDGLEIPHPRMHKRRFVLKPMCDIDPFIIHPILNKSVCALLAELDDKEQEIEEI